MSVWPHNLTLKPIDRWPGDLTPAARRKRSAFDSTLTSTLEVLTRELRELGATAVVLQMALDPEDFRLDGRPRANRQVAHPGVILSFDSRKQGPGLAYPCDTFTHWQDNLRGIALALEALRKIDRYGVSARGQQYAGFKAIEARAMPAEFGTQQAIEYLRSFLPAGSPVDRDGFRLAQRRAHPDTGGTAEKFDKVMRAGRVLGLVSS